MTNIPTLNMYNANRRISEVFSASSLANQRCFILAGGESISKLNFDLINKEFTIGINRSFEKYPTNILYCNDYDIYEMIIQGKLDEHAKDKILDKFIGFKGIKVFLAQPAENIRLKHNCFTVNRIYQQELNTEDLDRGIWAGSNSGLGALMLACALGCRDIYLLGFDMKITNKTHYHNGYPQQKIENYRKRIEIFKRDFFRIAPTIKMANINVTNLYIDSPEDTTLNCFQLKKLDGVIK